jgi:hypothetical protein
MPQRDSIHNLVRQALSRDGWEITDDPYVISYGERFLFVDLGAAETDDSRFIGARLREKRIAVEIKEFRGRSPIHDLEQAVGQYAVYRILLGRVDPEREIWLAVTDTVYDKIFSEPVGELVVGELPMKLIVINSEKAEVRQWITP